MGFNFTIGDAYLNYDKEERYLIVSAKQERHENAPAYGEPTDHSNSRWPSYTSWAEFCRFVGLSHMFDHKDESELNLIRSHPGFAALSENHKKEIDRVHKLFYIKYPNAVAGYSQTAKDFEPDLNWPIENAMATRLEWLKYWVDWALANCEIPIFYNS